MSELPKGWRHVTVGDVVTHCQSGFASGRKDVPGGLQQLRMNNVGLTGRLNMDLVRTVPPELASPERILKPGDVLVCTTNSGKLVGKSAYFNLQGRYAYSNHLTRLRPSSVIDGSFLRWALWLAWKSGAFEEHCKHWVNQSTLPKEALLALEIPLPPLPEQQRIVAKPALP